MGRTSIQVTDELADELHSRKDRGDSYEDVIWNLIEQADSNENGDNHREERSRREPEHEPTRVEQTAESGFEAHFSEVDFPASKTEQECVETVRAAYDFLREEGDATMRDFVSDVMPGQSLGYDVPDLEPGERYRGSWWRNIVKPGLEALPDVEKPASGESDWKYAGEGQ